MINFTPIARLAIERRATAAYRAACAPEHTQRQVLDWLLDRGKRTKWGQHCGLAAVNDYEGFAAAVPVHDYEYFRPYAMRMVMGESDVLWPGATKRYAQSSGTSGGKSKYIPITDDSLRLNHYDGARVSVATYLAAYPDSRMFSGKGLILGGSFANELEHLPPGVKVGDLSANLIDAISPVVNRFRVPNKDIALMADWEAKLPALVSAAVGEDITNISGVPSWFLAVLRRVLAATGRDNIAQVWPHLEVFIYGGISFKPYRNEYAKIMNPDMRYWQTYNASEGFIGAQCDPADDRMLLIQDAGVLYEFMPLDQLDSPHPQLLPSWAVSPGKTYALVITAPNGLWRYIIGDTVRIESIDPITISIAGRTNSYINAFGEEVMVYNTDASLAHTCQQMDCAIANYTAAPVYDDGSHRGRHQWLIEWTTPPADIGQFALALDLNLQRENSDYQAKRHGGIFLDNLEVVTARPALFDTWLKATGRLGGQRKVPRLRNDRALIEQLLKLNQELASKS